MPYLRRFIVSAILLLTAAAPSLTTAHNASVTSSWNTDFGGLSLTVGSDYKVKGHYHHNKGRISGKIDGNGRITAYWMQSTAGVRCNRQINGSYYWGVVVWDVMRGGNMQGSWSYCDQPRGSGGYWAANLQAGLSPMAILGRR